MTRAHTPVDGRGTAADGGVRLPKPPGVIRQFWARHPRLTDGLIAGVYTLSAVVAAIALAFVPDATWWPTALRLAAALTAGTALFLWRRTRPWLVIAIAWVVLIVVAPFGTDVFAVLLALYALGAYRSTRDAWIGFGASVAVGLLAAYIPVLVEGLWFATAPWGAAAEPTAAGTQFIVIMLIATLMGVTVGNRRRYLDALIARAHDLARERDQQARLAAADERARIAREMHDIVSHGLTVMITMAEGSAAAAPRDPVKAAELMRGVAESGREALGDMRRMLGVLTGPDAPAERRPQPDAGELPDLVDGFRDAGLPVRLTTTGVASTDPTLGLTVFRIVQEGLTNVLRHAAGPSRVDVAVEYTADAVDVVVEDDAPVRRGAPATTGAGRGLAGIRERAALYGGTVEAGPRPGHGWRLHAVLRTHEGDRRS